MVVFGTLNLIRLALLVGDNPRYVYSVEITRRGDLVLGGVGGEGSGKVAFRYLGIRTLLGN